MELIDAEQVNVDFAHVKKVDSRGSIITSLPSGKNDSLHLLE